tara:strand:- start:637 stop:849 length:213 start_codon:yes stop_codon:yes gene_type:complete
MSEINNGANKDFEDFEENLLLLQKIVNELESQDLSLSDTIKLYEKGQLLVKQCTKALEQAQLIITNYEKI